MGRKAGNGKDKEQPFRFILNHSKATAANAFLLLQPKLVLKRAIDRDPSLVKDVWKILQAIQPSDLVGEGRVYGGGLHKMEPKELANVRVDGIASLLEARGKNLGTFASQRPLDL